MHRITDPFFKQLYEKLQQEIEARVHALASGNSMTHGDNGVMSSEGTALRYASDVSHIRALQDVVGLGISIDKDIYGSKRTVDGDE